MSEINSKKSENCSARKELRMTPEAINVEMSDRTRELCRIADPNLKAAMQTVARRLGITAGRIKQLIYREARRVEAWEADRVRALHSQMAIIMARQAEIDAEMKRILKGEADGEMDRHSDDVVARHPGSPSPTEVRLVGSEALR